MRPFAAQLTLILALKLVVSELDRDAFRRAVKALYCAFRKFLVTSDCRFVFQPYVNEFETQEFLIASRLVIALSAGILDDAQIPQTSYGSCGYLTDSECWSCAAGPDLAWHRCSICRIKNTSKVSGSDSVYLAVRRSFDGLEI